MILCGRNIQAVSVPIFGSVASVFDKVTSKSSPRWDREAMVKCF